MKTQFMDACEAIDKVLFRPVILTALSCFVMGAAVGVYVMNQKHNEQIDRWNAIIKEAEEDRRLIVRQDAGRNHRMAVAQLAAVRNPEHVFPFLVAAGSRNGSFSALLCKELRQFIDRCDAADRKKLGKVIEALDTEFVASEDVIEVHVIPALAVIARGDGERLKHEATASWLLASLTKQQSISKSMLLEQARRSPVRTASYLTAVK